MEKTFLVTKTIVITRKVTLDIPDKYLKPGNSSVVHGLVIQAANTPSGVYPQPDKWCGKLNPDFSFVELDKEGRPIVEKCVVCDAPVCFERSHPSYPREYDVCGSCQAHICPNCNVSLDENPTYQECLDEESRVDNS